MFLFANKRFSFICLNAGVKYNLNSLYNKLPYFIPHCSFFIFSFVFK